MNGANDYNGALITAVIGGHKDMAKQMLELGANNYDEALSLAYGRRKKIERSDKIL